MLTIPTFVMESRTHGLGLFAADHIVGGSVVWQYVPDFDRYVSQTLYASLPDPARRFLDFYGNVNTHGDILICADDARFMNHSSVPNVSAAGDVNVALRDINVGEEILCEYSEFDAKFNGEFFRLILPVNGVTIQR